MELAKGQADWQAFTVIPLRMIPLMTVLAGCARVVENPPENHAYIHNRPVRELFGGNRLDDGIDAKEADILASVYFRRYDGLCGSNDPVILRGSLWRAGTTVGYGGVRQADITVHPVTGIVRQKGYPLSTPPWADLREVIRDPG